ncbi:MAG: formyltransferase family protein, partial [Bacteroidota bacterium]|nr:formyltransferase family protein [Bacteroidota bacterium]
MRLIFFGTPEFASTSLKAMIVAGFNIVGVVTAPDKQAGRGRKIQSSHVKETALELGLPVAQPTNLRAETFQEQIQKWKPDLGIVIAFR